MTFLQAGGELPCAGLLVPVQLHQRSALAAQLGAAAVKPGPLAADAIALDSMFRTTAHGVYAAGDVGSAMPSVANAVADGSNAPAMIVRDLMTAPPATTSVPAG